MVFGCIFGYFAERSLQNRSADYLYGPLIQFDGLLSKDLLSLAVCDTAESYRSPSLVKFAYSMLFNKSQLLFPLSIYSLSTLDTVEYEKCIVEIFQKLNDPCCEQIFVLNRRLQNREFSNHVTFNSCLLEVKTSNYM